MEISPYLFFRGNCGEAFRFYEKALRGKIEMMMTNAQSPMAAQTPAERQNEVLHVRMSVGDQVIMASDAPPEHYHKPQGFSISLSVNSADEAERVFKALSENGQVRMPLEKTFWAERFGMCADQFGISWMINLEKP